MDDQQTYNQAQEALRSGDKERTLTLLEQDAALAQDEGEMEIAIDSLQEAHTLAKESGQLEHATLLLEQAISLASKLDDPTLHGALLNNLAMAQKRAGHFEQAKETLNQSIQMLQRAEALNEEGTTWNNLGYVERDLGNLQQALICHQKALAIFKQTGDSGGTVRTLLETGIVHKDLGQLTEARIDLERAIALSNGQENALHDRGHALIGLGLVYQLLNEEQNALRSYEEALAIYRQERDRENEALALHNLGKIYDNKDDIEMAVRYYLQSLHINREIGAILGTADVLGSLASLYQASGNYKRARPMLKQALELYEAMGFREGQVDTLIDLGILARNSRHFRSAEKYMTRAIAVASAMNSPRMLYEAYLNRGDVNLFASKLRRAVEDYIAAIDAIEIIRDNLLSEEEALGFFKDSRLEAFDRLVRLFARGLHQPQQALVWVERSKGREFLRRLSVSELASNALVPPELQQQEMQLLVRLRQAAAGLANPDMTARHEALLQYEATVKLLNGVWDECERFDAEYVDLRRGETASWQEIRQLLAAEGK
jgi:tetratricopeptide (TPR) repeat protein